MALLSAAERHGAAHQAPMGFQVMVEPPVLRDKERDGYTIRYAERRQIPTDYVERKEVPAGWLNVSSPELTAVDLIAYQDHVGGLTRAATVLEELAMKLDFPRLDAPFLQVTPAPVFQRLKDRDLFDVYTALTSGELDLDHVMTAYDRYLRFVASLAPTYKEYVLNMDEKMQNPEFLGDTTGLLRPLLEYDPQTAQERVRDEIVAKLLPPKQVKE